jgi:hypothetical protein
VVAGISAEQVAAATSKMREIIGTPPVARCYLHQS